MWDRDVCLAVRHDERIAHRHRNHLWVLFRSVRFVTSGTACDDGRHARRREEDRNLYDVHRARSCRWTPDFWCNLPGHRRVQGCRLLRRYCLKISLPLLSSDY